MFGLKLLKKMKANKKKSEGEGKGGGFNINFKAMSGSMMQMLGGFSILRASSMLGMVNVSFTKEQLLGINKKLNKINKKN